MKYKASPGWAWMTGAIVLGLLAFGCASGINLTADGTARPTPTRAPTQPPTHAPSMLPTASPSLETPAAISPSPDTSSWTGRTKRVAYSVFVDHVEGSLGDLALIVGSVKRHSDPVNVPRLIVDLDDGAEWSAKLSLWLQKNQPRPCYESRHSALLAAVARWEQGFAQMASALTSLDQLGLMNGMAMVQQADELLEAAEAETCTQRDSEG